MNPNTTKANPHADKPYISNYPPLDEWLKRHEARCAWQRYDARMNLEGWMIGTRLCIVMVHANGGGWDIFTPSPSLIVTETLRDAEERLRP